MYEGDRIVLDSHDNPVVNHKFIPLTLSAHKMLVIFPNPLFPFSSLFWGAADYVYPSRRVL